MKKYRFFEPNGLVLFVYFSIPIIIEGINKFRLTPKIIEIIIKNIFYYLYYCLIICEFLSNYFHQSKYSMVLNLHVIHYFNLKNTKFKDIHQ